MHGQMSEVLIGRESLSDQVSCFLSGPRERSALLVGEPGVGRSALLRAAARTAAEAGYGIVHVAGAERTGQTALGRVMDRLGPAADRLADVHRQALRAAERGPEAPDGAGPGESDGDGVAAARGRPSPLLLGTAVVALLREASSASAPLLLAVDDAHAMDPASARALAFAARRLNGSATWLLASSLTDSAVFTDRTVDRAWTVPPLTPEQAMVLARQYFPVLSPQVRRTLVEEAAGRPRPLVESGYAAVALAAAMPDAVGATRTSDFLVAGTLVRASEHARGRGHLREAVAALRRAAELTAQPGLRAQRFADAACAAALVTGEPVAVAGALAEAAHDAVAAGSLAAVTASCTLAVNDQDRVEAVHARLLRTMREQGAFAEPWVLGEAVWLLFILSWHGMKAEQWTAFRAVVAQFEERMPRWAVIARAMMSDGGLRPDLRREGDRLIENLTRAPDPAIVVRSAFVVRARDRRVWWRRALEQVLRPDRDEVLPGPALFAASILGMEAIVSGDWEQADRLVSDGLELARSRGYRLYHEAWLTYADTLLAAYRGDAEKVRSQTAALLAWGRRRGVRSVEVRARHVRAALALGTGYPAAAHRQLTAIADPAGYAAPALYDDRIALDLAEAATGAGAHSDLASLRSLLGTVDVTAGDRRALVWSGALAIVRSATPAGTTTGGKPLAGSAASTGATSSKAVSAEKSAAGVPAAGFPSAQADAAEVDAGFRRALGVRDADRWPFDLARIRLAYGEWLRSVGDTDRARDELRAAADAFRHLGALPWLARATDLLRVLGDVAARGDTGVALTPMERRVAELAASGLTNREIGAELRLPASTVSSHLSRTYAKLGIQSRAALRDALEQRAP